jgi:hypothetical protein
LGLGEIWWLAKTGSRAEPRWTLGAVNGLGLLLRHPLDEAVVVLDEEGHRRETDEEWLLAEWARTDRLTMQLWLDRDTDVLFEIKDQGSQLTFDLDGLTVGEAARVTATLLLLASTCAATAALLVDSHLPDDEGWKKHLLGQGSRPAREPDLLLGSPGTPAGLRQVSLRDDSWLRAIG